MKIDAALTCGTDVKTLRRGHPVMIPRVPDRLRPRVRGHGERGGARRHAASGKGTASWPRTRRRAGSAARARAAAPTCARTSSSSTAPTASTSPCRRAWWRPTPSAPSRRARARAAFAEPLACALLAIERADVQAGQTVARPRARAARLPARDGGDGARGPGDHGRAPGLAARAGARAGVVGVPRCLGVADVAAEIRARTDGRGAEVAVDATGRPEVWEQAVDAVGRGGSRGVLRRMCAGDEIGSTPVECTTRNWRCSGPSTTRRRRSGGPWRCWSRTLVARRPHHPPHGARRRAGGAGPDGQERGAQGADRAVSRRLPPGVDGIILARCGARRSRSTPADLRPEHVRHLARGGVRPPVQRSRASTSPVTSSSSASACASDGCPSTPSGPASCAARWSWASSPCTSSTSSRRWRTFRRHRAPSVRYHFLSLGRFVPYVEVAGAAGGHRTSTSRDQLDLHIRRRRPGLGASYFVTDRTAAVYAGYRYGHISNGHTSSTEPRVSRPTRRIRGCLLLLQVESSMTTPTDRRPSPRSCWPAPAASARGWSAPSTSWSWPSRCARRPCTCARRSCTTGTSWRRSAPRARSSWTSWTRSPTTPR